MMVEAGFVAAMCCVSVLHGSQRDSMEGLVRPINEILTNCSESCRPLVRRLLSQARPERERELEHELVL